VFELSDEKEIFLSVDELRGIFNCPDDLGNFVLDLESVREERAENILNKKTISE
jgi:hypothetical protein